ncbi:MAG TPA: archaellin/type IV pilin N-terminal domain-containing protein [Thermoplasmata archaeon]|nr:archaellin/type IV pilin N-terminal domain-containing protein [Thermoplasmata archaeon]
MKSIIRKDEAAVSPVIATILMVAITVVLAAVLYVMVSGLLTPTGGGPRAIGVLPGRSQDGTNWTLTFTSVPSGLTVTGTKLTVITGGGATSLASTAFGSLVYATNKAAYIQSVSGSSVGVGDRLLISTTTYPTGYTYQISDGTSILSSGTLQG